jgi:hypothetical protein
MRGLALAAALALSLAACVAPGPRQAPPPGTSYNRRDLPPERGVFSGPDGVWTIYRNDEDRPAQGGGILVEDDPEEGAGPR